MQILLILLLILQVIVLVHLLYTNQQRYKHDKKFWEATEKINKQLCKDLEERNALLFTEGDVASEQEKEDKSL